MTVVIIPIGYILGRLPSCRFKGWANRPETLYCRTVGLNNGEGLK